jgi:hypothetical protein
MVLRSRRQTTSGAKEARTANHDRATGKSGSSQQQNRDDGVYQYSIHSAFNSFGDAGQEKFGWAKTPIVTGNTK